MSAHDATTLSFLPLLIHPHSISFSDLETLAGDRPRPPPHPLMPPYGTPIHYPAMYPPEGVYAHHNIGKIANTSGVAQADGKGSDVKDQSSAKKSRGNSGAGNEKTTENGKATSVSGNNGAL